MIENSTADIWPTIAKAAGFIPSEKAELLGSSGINHSFALLAVDEERKRIFTISKEPDPRVAALIHHDVSTNIQDYRLLTARPVAFNLQQLAANMATALGSPVININDTLNLFKEHSNKLKRAKKRGTSEKRLNARTQETLDAFGLTAIVLNMAAASRLRGLDLFEQVNLVLKQIATLNINEVFPDTSNRFSVLDLTKLLQIDTQFSDREQGLCALPLYDLSERDIELFASGARLEEAKARLTSLDVMQYFEPPLDHAALAVADRGAGNADDIVAAINKLPQLGHPLAPSEFIKDPKDVLEIVDALQERKFLVEGELGLQVTEAGASLRSTVKFKPREGAISKIAKKMRINLDLSTKGWFTIGNKSEK